MQTRLICIAAVLLVSLCSSVSAIQQVWHFPNFRETNSAPTPVTIAGAQVIGANAHIGETFPAAVTTNQWNTNNDKPAVELPAAALGAGDDPATAAEGKKNIDQIAGGAAIPAADLQAAPDRPAADARTQQNGKPVVVSDVLPAAALTDGAVDGAAPAAAPAAAAGNGLDACGFDACGRYEGMREATVVNSLSAGGRSFVGDAPAAGAAGANNGIMGELAQANRGDAEIIKLEQEVADLTKKIEDDKKWIAAVKTITEHYKEKAAAVAYGVRSETSTLKQLQTVLREKEKANARRVLEQKLAEVNASLQQMKRNAATFVAQSASLTALKANLHNAVTQIRNGLNKLR